MQVAWQYLGREGYYLLNPSLLNPSFSTPLWPLRVSCLLPLLVTGTLPSGLTSLPSLLPTHGGRYLVPSIWSHRLNTTYTQHHQPTSTSLAAAHQPRHRSVLKTGRAQNWKGGCAFEKAEGEKAAADELSSRVFVSLFFFGCPVCSLPTPAKLSSPNPLVIPHPRLLLPPTTSLARRAIPHQVTWT